MAFSTEKENLSYALGMNMCKYLQHLPLEIDIATFTKAFADYDKGGKFQFTPEEYTKYMTEFQTKAKAAGEQTMKEIAERNLELGRQFLEQNKARAEVKTTASGLQYEVLKEGTGAIPGKSDTVKVHYTGSLINGEVFDSSVERGMPAEFGVNQVIPGWTEALQLMKVGSKYKLFIPSLLAYGARGAGDRIPPNSTLIFEVELLSIEK